MNKPDAVEATGLVQRLLTNLSLIISDKGDAGVMAKVAIGVLFADIQKLLVAETIGVPLATCFEKVRQTNCTVQQMEAVRIKTAAETPVTLGATLVRDYAIQMCLAEEALIIGGLTFSSRQDVDALFPSIAAAFDPSEETAADTMDAMVYQGLVALRAALVNHLVQTARPLPSMVLYQFGAILPSLVISQKLYGDASRYDEIRNENKIVHPAFCPTIGMALSS